MWRWSPVWTSRDGFASCPFERMRLSSQAREARARVLKKRAAQSHLSIRTPVIVQLSYRPCAATSPPRRRPKRNSSHASLRGGSADHAAEKFSNGLGNFVDV